MSVWCSVSSGAGCPRVGRPAQEVSACGDARGLAASGGLCLGIMWASPQGMVALPPASPRWAVVPCTRPRAGRPLSCCSAMLFSPRHVWRSRGCSFHRRRRRQSVRGRLGPVCVGHSPPLFFCRVGATEQPPRWPPHHARLAHANRASQWVIDASQPARAAAAFEQNGGLSHPYGDPQADRRFSSCGCSVCVVVHARLSATELFA